MERSEGPILVPGDEAVRLTGIEAVVPRDEFAAALDAVTREGRTVYTPHRGESLGAFTPWAVDRHERLSSADPWDGRLSREATFIARIKARAPQVRVEDLDPILDRMRLVKSRREIEAIREATRISSAGILEAMKAARPGQKERELAAVADYVFRKNGAQGVGYFALVATGKNAHYPHYHGGESVLQDGDLVLFDYAPDVANYTSDVTRMFPANGRFTPWQREIYTVYLRCYRALMAELKPGRTARQVHDAAFAKMRQIVDGTTFSRSQGGRGGAQLHRPVRAGTPRRARRPLGRHGSARRRRRPRRRRPPARHGLHDRAGADHSRGSRLRPPRGRDRDHRDRLREPVGVAALRDRRHRSDDGGAGPAKPSGPRPSVHHPRPDPSSPDPSHDTIIRTLSALALATAFAAPALAQSAGRRGQGGREASASR